MKNVNVETNNNNGLTAIATIDGMEVARATFDPQRLGGVVIYGAYGAPSSLIKMVAESLVIEFSPWHRRSVRIQVDLAQNSHRWWFALLGAIHGSDGTEVLEATEA